VDISRGDIQDAITAWRDGKTFDARHPLADQPDHGFAVLWDDNAMKDLARVIMATIEGRDIPSADVPW
jgi:hypothetical protein